MDGRIGGREIKIFPSSSPSLSFRQKSSEECADLNAECIGLDDGEMCSRKRGARQCSRQHNNLHSIPQNWISRPRKKSGQTKQSLLILKPKANMDVFPIFVKNGDRV